MPNASPPAQNSSLDARLQGLIPIDMCISEPPPCGGGGGGNRGGGDQALGRSWGVSCGPRLIGWQITYVPHPILPSGN